ncbi:MAG TPA: ATP-binding protein, partial [Candidatus Sulfotelmatobacter sp.]|nr:ATP-binding protein [Candidatus Sulfotelmatobacter sp.]
SQRQRAEALLRLQRDLGVRLSLTSDLDTALRCLLEAAVHLEAVDAAGIYLLDEATGGLSLAAHQGISEAFVQRVTHYSADAPQTQRVQAGRPAYSSGERLLAEAKEDFDLEGLQSAAIIPLSHEGRVLGCLSLGSHLHKKIPPQTRMVAEAIAAQAAGAMARIRAETALRESQARLQTIIAGASIFVFVADRTGTIVYEAGQGFFALGPNPQPLVGRKVQEVCVQYPQVLENMRRVLRGEKFHSTVDFGSMVFDCWYSPTCDPSGEITGYTAVATNVTQRSRLERQILEISDREQARIGQDIHDGLCQQLVGLAFDANALEQQLFNQRLPEAATARRIADYLDQAISEARQLSRGLFPIRLETDGLISALEELARSTGERFGFSCRFQCPEPVVVKSHAIATHLYRIAQEAVNNASKHAHPQLITIQLLAQGDTLELRVEDDGCGLPATVLKKPFGMGLPIMEYRARRLGGTLRLGPGLHGGTIVSCCLPWERPSLSSWFPHL